jgi:hypothetical protein
MSEVQAQRDAADAADAVADGGGGGGGGPRNRVTPVLTGDQLLQRQMESAQRNASSA